MLAEFDKWPLILQVFAYLGAAAAGAFVLLRGAKAKPEETPLELELKAIRADFAVAIEALKTSMHGEFASLRQEIKDYEARLRDTETTVAVLDDRDRRPRR